MPGKTPRRDPWNNREVVLKMSPARARMIGEMADREELIARQQDRFNDARDWEAIARTAHLAADRGVRYA